MKPREANIWSQVEKTDPRFTKRTSKGGSHEFTAIDPYYQIKRATDLFGPVGWGWGWNLVDAKRETSVAYVIIELWYTTEGEPGAQRPNHSFIVFGETALYGKPSQDEDALKKALTDAITKGLSYLGFSADVYLGKFDDNKYVEQRKRETKEDTKPAFSEDDPRYKNIANAIAEAKDVVQLLKVRENYRDQVLKLHKDQQHALVKLLSERMAALEPDK